MVANAKVLKALSNSHIDSLDIDGLLTAGQFTINATEAKNLAAVNMGFAKNDKITLDINDARSAAHLANSLSSLEKLGVDSIHLDGGLKDKAGLTVHDLSLDLGDGVSIGDLSLSDLPKFDFGGVGDLNVSLNVSQNQAFDIVANPDVLDALTNSGINHLAIAQTLQSSIDWLDFKVVQQAHSTHPSMGIEFDLVGSLSQFDSFDNSLRTAISDDTYSDPNSTWANGIDLLANFSSPDKYGYLVESLLQSGVTDFVVESGNVEITDHLAAAMVQSGMLQALPDANLVIDATAQFMKINGIEDFAHLYTDLKSIAALDIDGIRVQDGVDRVYLELGDYGIPTNDSAALSDIQDLLASLDPANFATPVNGLAHDANGHKVDISLVMSADMAKALSDLNLFTERDMGNLAMLGIDRLAVVSDSSSTHPDISNLVPATTATTTAPQLPQVEIIGADTQKDLHDELSSHLKH